MKTQYVQQIEVTNESIENCTVSICNKTVAFCNTKPGAFCNKLLLHFVIK